MDVHSEGGIPISDGTNPVDKHIKARVNLRTYGKNSAQDELNKAIPSIAVCQNDGFREVLNPSTAATAACSPHRVPSESGCDGWRVSPRRFCGRTYMMTACGRSALTFSAASSASVASATTWSAFPFSLKPTVNCICNLHALLCGGVSRLAQRVDDFPIGCFGKRLQRAGPDVSKHAQLEVEAGRHGVVGSLIDRHEVIVAHREKDGFELAAHVLEGFLRKVQTTRRVLDLQDALLGPIRKHDVCGHHCPPWF